MTIENPCSGATCAAGDRSDSGLAPRSSPQVDDQDWVTLRSLAYQAKTDDFEVPVNERLISPPCLVYSCGLSRATVAIPSCYSARYLCSIAVPAGRISRIEADGIFRRPCGNSASRSCAVG